MPKEAFFKDVTRVFKKFEDERKKRGWPVFIHCPLDEVAIPYIEFGVKCYKAVKDAGCKVYITKIPTSVDADAYAPYVDVFCGTPFDVDYAKTQNSSYEYWAYPNHNAGEIKISKVMCKGGRMTYGFGLWRSGYTTLIPWIWRWEHNPMFEFDYLKHKKISQTGTQLDENGDENGEVIPTPYWMCFREGIDDARYLYTLQSAIVERDGSKNPDCEKLVKEGRELIQTIWDNIEPQQKYKSRGMWPSSEFDAVRWKMAVLIEKLLKFPAIKKAVSPSVIIDTSPKKKKTDRFFDEQTKKGNIEIFDLGSEDFAGWKSVTKEGTTSVTQKIVRTGKNALEYKVKIDHKTDGGGEKGDYSIGWPRIKINFPMNTMDMTKYDYLSMWIMVDSDRNEVADDYTFLSYNIASWDKKAPRFLFNKELLGIVPQRTWLQALIPVKEMRAKHGYLNKELWENIRMMQIWLGESRYAHRDNLTFYIDDISLIRMKKPTIKSVYFPHYVTLPEKYIVAKPEIMGLKESGDPVKAWIIDAAGKVVFEKTEILKDEGQIILDIAKLKPGKYQLKVSLENNPDSSITEDFEAINGPCVK